MSSCRGIKKSWTEVFIHIYSSSSTHQFCGAITTNLVAILDFCQSPHEWPKYKTTDRDLVHHTTWILFTISWWSNFSAATDQNLDQLKNWGIFR